MTTDFVGESHILLAFIASFLAGSATAIGALAVYFVRQLSPLLEDTLLSVAAGIMLAASIFSLILPGIDYATLQHGSKVVAVLVVTAGIGLGALLLWSLHHLVPHEHLHMGREGPEAQRLARIWLFIFAITLHNLPEGIAVGVGMMQQDVAAGAALALGIGLQNIPEGLAVSVALLTVGYRHRTAILAGVASGLVEPLGGLFGAVAVWLAAPLLPLFLGLAGGAMLFIISDEIIPETHRRDAHSHVTFALLGGFALMMFLDVVLG
jgi:ZIP family zinc transporter